MGRKSKKSSEEFKIERIHGSRDEIESDHLKQRSLVFRISKRSREDIKKEIDKPETLLATDCLTLTENKIIDKHSALSTMSNGEEQTELKIQSPNENNDGEWSKTLVKERKFAKRDSSELRRTSRKIIVRVNKDFIGTNFIKMARKKKCTESAPINLNNPDEVVVKRGRGRPRKPKPIPSPPEISKKADDGAVWTLVPKEMIDSDYFKSQVLQVHYPQETGLSTKPFLPPPKTFPRLKFPFTPLQNKENVGARTDIIPNEIPHQFQEEQYYSSPPGRPTVIYFKQPKNFSSRVIPNSEELQDNKNRGFRTSRRYGANKGWQIDYLLRKYNNLIERSEIEYFFGVSGGNLRKTEELLSDVLPSGNELLRTDSNGQLGVTNDEMIYKAQTFQVHEKYICVNQRSQGSSNIKSSCTTDSQTPKEFPDTLFRKVIVDSIKLLYDEDSVLGYL